MHEDDSWSRNMSFTVQALYFCYILVMLCHDHLLNSIFPYKFNVIIQCILFIFVLSSLLV